MTGFASHLYAVSAARYIMLYQWFVNILDVPCAYIKGKLLTPASEWDGGARRVAWLMEQELRADTRSVEESLTWPIGHHASACLDLCYLYSRVCFEILTHSLSQFQSL